MTHQRIALLLGATGGIGGEVARRLRASGWAVKAMHRNVAKAASNRNAVMGVSWVEGDAMRPADVEKAARGTSLIVHAVNPPGYRSALADRSVMAPVHFGFRGAVYRGCSPRVS